uniref:COX6C domain-containing protein n=1 Tax=Strongyloides papillosus TaxID=174720 RepID=A0A0N5C870_STREA
MITNLSKWFGKFRGSIIAVVFVGGVGTLAYGSYKASLFVKRVSASKEYNYHQEMEDYIYHKELEARKNSDELK